MESGFFPLCYADDEGEMQSGQADGKWSVAYFSEEEFDELCFRAAQKETKWAWKWALIIFISIFGLVFGYYYIFDPSGLE